MPSPSAALLCLATFASPAQSPHMATTGAFTPSARSEARTTHAARKPSAHDADVLLALMQVYFSDSIVKARRLWRKELTPGMSLEDFEARFPRGSEGYEHFINLASFWETVGSLIQRGLVSEDLAFDTFLDAPPWEKAEKIFKGRRERDKEPLEGVNFEWVTARAAEWVSRHERELQKKGARAP